MRHTPPRVIVNILTDRVEAGWVHRPVSQTSTLILRSDADVECVPAGLSDQGVAVDSAGGSDGSVCGRALMRCNAGRRLRKLDGPCVGGEAW